MEDTRLKNQRFSAMMRWLLARKLDAEERRLGASVDYLRHILKVSPTAFFRFASLMPLAGSRKTLPADAWYVAQLVAVQAEDCGPCLQITVNLAKQDGVKPELIKATLNGDLEQLSADLCEVYKFAEAVLQQTADVDPLRETLRSCYGERALIELSYAIAAGRVPPTVKRVLGFAKSCSAAPIDV